MPFAYYDRLSSRNKAIYRRSDEVVRLELPHAELLHPLVDALREALERDDRRAVEKALKCLIERSMADEKKPVQLDARQRNLLPKLPDDAMRETVTDLLLAKVVIQRRVKDKIGLQLKRLGEELPDNSNAREEFDLYSVMLLVLRDWAQERFDTGAGLLKQYV